MLTYKTGDLYPVWWSTGETNESGSNMARILEIRSYLGLYQEHFEYIFKLACPNTKKGWIEMTIPKEEFIKSTS